MNAMKKKILFVSTGGTIASVCKASSGYSPTQTDMSELLKCAPELLEQADVIQMDHSSILSFLMTPDFIMDMVVKISERVKQDGFDGVVVAQGTAMLEESPFLADLFWNSEVPLVFTGAMFNKSEPDWDGSRNVCNAIAIALSPESRGRGALVTLGGEIHAARDAVKTHKTSLAPIESVNFGRLGNVINCSKVVYYRNAVRRTVFEKPALQEKVDIVKVSMGSSGILISALAEAGYKAVVIEALPGGGGVSQEVFDAVEKYKDKLLFVMCPRSQGGVCISKAGGGTGPVNLKKLGVLTAGDLNSVKTRLFLMAAMAKYETREEIEKALDAFAM